MDIVSKFIQKNYQKYLENFNYLVISDWPDLKSQYYIRGIHKKTLQLDLGGILTRDLTIKSHKINFYDYNLKTGRYFNIAEYFIFYKPNKLPKINKTIANKIIINKIIANKSVVNKTDEPIVNKPTIKKKDAFRIFLEAQLKLLVYNETPLDI